MFMYILCHRNNATLSHFFLCNRQKVVGLEGIGISDERRLNKFGSFLVDNAIYGPYIVRLFNYIPGEPLYGKPYGQTTMFDIGHQLALLHNAMEVYNIRILIKPNFSVRKLFSTNVGLTSIQTSIDTFLTERNRLMFVHSCNFVAEKDLSKEIFY